MRRWLIVFSVVALIAIGISLSLQREPDPFPFLDELGITLVEKNAFSSPDLARIAFDQYASTEDLKTVVRRVEARLPASSGWRQLKLPWISSFDNPSKPGIVLFLVDETAKPTGKLPPGTRTSISVRRAPSLAERAINAIRSW